RAISGRHRMWVCIVSAILFAATHGYSMSYYIFAFFMGLVLMYTLYLADNFFQRQRHFTN
ncbi:MAG: CPBP family intramembrane metalloprotease, partial [Saprospiraceae bacterium]|nr:CPBP family intramembrane metalloprotease [Saprospiraceae bacterium]